MATKRQDVRVTKTQRTLAYAMLALLEHNAFAKITINDICQEALVSRSTFYAHFEDKYQLLSFCMQELRRQLSERTDAMEPYDFMLASLKAVQEHANVYRNIFLADPSRELMRMFQGHFYRLLERVMPQRKSHVIPIDVATEYLSVYFTGGIASTMSWWIEQGFQISAEQLAQCQWLLLESVMAM